MQNVDLHGVGHGLSAPKHPVWQVAGWLSGDKAVLWAQLCWRSVSSHFAKSSNAKAGLMDGLDFFHYNFSLRLKIQSFWLHINVNDG